MTTVAQLWNRLDDGQKGIAFKALHHFLGDAGAELVRAVAEHAEQHLQAAIADRENRTRVIPTPADALLPPEAAGPAVEPSRCQDCGRQVNGDLLAWGVVEHGSTRIVWVGEGCYRDRLLHKRRGPEVAGDQLQAFPTPLPIREGP
jgi:hypothetical protein